MKVAVAVGPARRFVVGDPEIQLIDVLAGRLIDQLAEAEHHAEQGRGGPRRVGARRARRPRRDRARSGVDADDRPDRSASSRAWLVDVADAPTAEEPPRARRGPRPAVAPAGGLRAPARPGRGEFLAELRPAYPLFVRFGGIDYDDDDDAIAKLDDFVRARAADHRRLRRQRAAADARRQGRLPVRRLRLAARPRGRRGARGRGSARAARARAIDRRHATSRSGSPTAGCAAARTATRCAGRSSASATRSTSRRGSCRRRPPGEIYVSRSRRTRPPATPSLGVDAGPDR